MKVVASASDADPMVYSNVLLPGGNMEADSGWTGGSVFDTTRYHDGDQSLKAGSLEVLPRRDFATPFNFAAFDSFTIWLLWYRRAAGANLSMDLRIRFYSDGLSKRSAIIVPQGIVALDTWYQKTFDPGDAVAELGGGADMANVDRVEMLGVYSLPVHVEMVADEWRGTFTRGGRRVAIGGAKVRSFGPKKFESGFEGNLEVFSFAAGDGNWRGGIRGTDFETKARWLDVESGESDLPGFGKTSFRYQVATASNLATYVETSINVGDVPGGGTGKRLRMAVLKDDPINPDLTRNAFVVLPDGTGAFAEAYAAYWIKIQSNIATIQTAGWRELVSLVGVAERSAAFQIVNVGGVLRWRLLEKPCLDDCPSDWTVDNTEYAIPAGTWSYLEVGFWNSFIRVRINGHTIAEGASMMAALSEFRPLSVYWQGAIVGADVAFQDVDDLLLRVGPGAVPGDW